MTVPQDLIERVRKATGPDRELDVAVLCALPPFGTNWHPDSRWNGRATFLYASEEPGGVSAPPYTASIDAALALAERVLNEDEALEILSMVATETSEDTVNGSIKVIPLAIVLATLLALQSSEQSK